MITRRTDRTNPTAGTTLVLSAGVTGLTAVLVLTVRFGGRHPDAVGPAWWYLASWALFAGTVVALRRVPARHVSALVLLGGIAVAVAGLAAAPTTSTDSYRYAWDGRVQAAGISPYDHAPADPALARLRDTWLFPTGAACAGPDHAPVPPASACTRINRPQVHTIYPPVAEAYFFLVHELSPPGARHKPLQIGGAVTAVATTAALLLILRRRGLDPRHAALWAWCPAVPLEAVNNAHVDALAVLFTIAALAALTVATPPHRGSRTPQRGRRGGVPRTAPGWRILGGALLGLAIAAKLLPAIVLPAALAGLLATVGLSARRRARELGRTAALDRTAGIDGWSALFGRAGLVVVPALVVVGCVYLPYVLASRSSVLGYLGGYVREEGYDDPGAGHRFVLLRLVLPGSWALPAVTVVMTAVVLYCLRRGDPRRPWAAAVTVTGTAFLLMTPGYSWYALLLVALVALDGRWEWLTVAMAGAVVYLAGRTVPDPAILDTGSYGLAAMAALAGTIMRARATALRSGALRRAFGAPVPRPGCGAAPTDWPLTPASGEKAAYDSPQR